MDSFQRIKRSAEGKSCCHRDVEKKHFFVTVFVVEAAKKKRPMIVTVGGAGQKIWPFFSTSKLGGC
jgi:hypothetical protein